MARKKKKYQYIEPMDVTLTIEDVSFMGDGVAHHDGEMVFVPDTIPGETVEATIWRKSRRYLEAELKRVVEPSPHRVEPACRYVGACTGCQWQHIAYSHQLDIKTRLVREQLRRVGGFSDVPVEAAIGCDHPWAYRNHARFTIGPDGALGFVNKAHRRFVRIEQCPIMDEGVNGLLAKIQDKCGETTQLSIRYGVKTGDWLIQPTLQSPDVAVDSGQQQYCDALLGHRFTVSSSSFFQVNTKQAERLVELVRTELALTGQELLVDAYAGVGTFAVLLAPYAGAVVAIEESASAVKDARENIRGLVNVTLVEARTEEAMAGLGQVADAVILDPPRAGCHPSAISSLAELGPKRVVYVSCDPESLARDLRLLCDGPFALERVQPLDMFPHTHHIEAVATLRRR